MRSQQVAWVALAALTAWACHTMAPLTLEDVQLQRPARVWVTQDQSTMEVSGPQVFNDTLVGYVNGEYQELPAASLSKVVTKRPARAKTIGLAAAGTVGLAAFIWAIAGTEKYTNPKQSSGTDCDDDPEHPDCQ